MRWATAAGNPSASSLQVTRAHGRGLLYWKCPRNVSLFWLLFETDILDAYTDYWDFKCPYLCFYFLILKDTPYEYRSLSSMKLQFPFLETLFRVYKLCSRGFSVGVDWELDSMHTAF